MKVGSLFAGVGGFDLAAEAAGMEVEFQAENDPAASRVLEAHWPDKNLGDIHGIETPPAVDVLVGGFPCTDYSVAGTRSGLAGDSGALWWEFRRLIDAGRPDWVVGENVAGILSSRGGRDFATIVDSLTEHGYGVVWAVLDSQWSGVAQRRRRLFLVGHSGGIPRPEILALGEGMQGHPRPSRAARPSPSSRFEDGAPVPYRKATKDGWDKGFERWELDDVTGTLNTQGDTAGTVVTTSEAIADGELARSLGAVGGGNDIGANKGTIIYRLEAFGKYRPDGVSSTVQSRDFKSATDLVVNARQDPITVEDGSPPLDAGRPQHAVLLEGAETVRRLTPLECERLQGFPDDWTKIPGNTDSMRYRQMGNAVTVPVVRWIMERIAKEATNA